MKNPASGFGAGWAGGSDCLCFMSGRRRPHRSSERENKYRYEYEEAPSSRHDRRRRNKCGQAFRSHVLALGHGENLVKSPVLCRRLVGIATQNEAACAKKHLKC